MTFTMVLRATDANGVDSRWFFPGMFNHQIGSYQDGGFLYLNSDGSYLRMVFTAGVVDGSKGFDVTASSLTKIELQSASVQDGHVVATNTLGTLTIDQNGGGGYMFSAFSLTPDAIFNYTLDRTQQFQFALQGYSGNDKLFGSNYHDFINGQNGNDLLTGYGGADEFCFDAWGKANFDHVTDFEHGIDTVLIDKTWLEYVDPTKAKQQFHDITKGGMHAEQANDRLLYDRDTGTLYYDIDGAKAHGAKPEIIAIFDNHAKLDLGDFDFLT